MTNEECIAQLESAGYAVSKPATQDEMAQRAWNAAYNGLLNLADAIRDGGRIPTDRANTHYNIRRLIDLAQVVLQALPENER